MPEVAAFVMAHARDAATPTDHAAAAAAAASNRRMKATLSEAGLALAAMTLLERINEVLLGRLPRDKYTPAAAALLGDVDSSTTATAAKTATKKKDMWYAGDTSDGAVVAKGLQSKQQARLAALEETRAAAAALTVVINKAVIGVETGMPVRFDFVLLSGHCSPIHKHKARADLLCARVVAAQRFMRAAVHSPCWSKCLTDVGPSAHTRVVQVQSLMMAPLAILAEGGFAHALHSLLVWEPLSAMVTSSNAHEATFRLLTATFLKDTLKPLLLQPAGPPPVLELRRPGFDAAGQTVAEATAVVARSAERFQSEGSKLNEVNEEGIHIGVDASLQFVLFLLDTGTRLQDVRSSSATGEAKQRQPPLALPLSL